MRLAFGCALLLGFAAAIVAQEPDAPAEGESRTGEIQEERRLSWAIDPMIEHFDVKERALVLMGNVDARIDDITIRCSHLIAWLADPKAGPAGEERPDRSLAGERGQERLERFARSVKEVYAEGTVIFSQGGEWTRAEAIFLDLVNERGIVVDATFELPLRSGDQRIDIVVRADELRLIARDRIQAAGVKMTTCSFGHPHYHLSSRQLEIIKERAPPAPPGTRERVPLENYHMEVEGNVFYLGALPVLWLPDFVGDTAGRRPFQYIEDVRYRRSNRFGHEVGVTIGDDITAGDNQAWGHWSIPIDWYTKRGPGIGVDIAYSRPGGQYSGALITRYQRDHGDDRFFGEPPTKNRGRIAWYHRHWLPGEVQLDLELQLFSDRGYYPTYFEDEDKRLKPPENLVYLKRAFFNSYLTGLFSTRLNHWETVSEYKPELRYDLVYEPLFEVVGRPLYLDSTIRLSRNRLRFDDDLDLRGGRTLRADLDTLVEYPVAIGPLTLTPFAGIRYTWYERDLDREDRDRIGFTHGATLSLQAWRTFDIEGGFLNLDGLRHVMYPTATFRNTVGVQVHPDELLPFDDVDAFDNVQVLELRIRNLLQTVRHRARGPAVDNLVDLELEIDYFPNANRDHGGRPWGNLEVDFVFRPSDELQLASDLELSWHGQRLEVFNAAAGYTPSRELQVYAGFRHFEDTYDAIFFQTNWRLDEKWLVTLDTGFDLRDDRGLDHRITFSRIGHDWVIQLGLRADIGENDYSISFSIEPRLFFDPILKPRSLRNEPRLIYLGSGVTN